MSSSTATKFCPQCGNRLDGAAGFCSQCGTSLAGSTSVGDPGTSTQNVAATSVHENSRTAQNNRYASSSQTSNPRAAKAVGVNSPRDNVATNATGTSQNAGFAPQAPAYGQAGAFYGQAGTAYVQTGADYGRSVSYGYGTPAVAKQPRHGLAVAAMVLGIISLALPIVSFGTLSFVAIICGIVAVILAGAAKAGGNQSGLCVAGLVTGLISVAFGVFELIACGGVIASLSGATGALSSLYF